MRSGGEGLYGIRYWIIVKAKVQPKMPSRLERVICHNGLEKVPEHFMAAVKNLGQCMQV